LDWADQQTGVMRFVAASHRDPQVFQPNLFVSDEPIPGTAGPRVPDVDALGDQVKIVSFDLGPGDLTIHHAATLHAAGANRSPDRRRRALSIRYVGDDVAFLRREGTILKPYQRTLIDGDPLPAEECPVAWRREAR
jgi:ectoine hydroxylase-related dioxygenase (phytanoyl-CoA dioxygenase family)